MLQLTLLCSIIFLRFIRKHCSQHSLAILDVCLESSFTDEVVLHSFSLMTLPGSSGVFRAPLVSRKSKLENKTQDTGCLYVSGYLIKLDTDCIKKQCVYCKINKQNQRLQYQRDTCLSRYQFSFLCFANELLKAEHLSKYTKVCNSLSQTSTNSMYDSFILACFKVSLTESSQLLNWGKQQLWWWR